MQVHVEDTSRVADHCFQHSLGSDSVPNCQHTHDELGGSCEILKEVITEIENAVDTVPLPSWEVKDDMTFTVETAKQEINAFKAHQLRYVKQDMARSDILDKVSEETMLFTQDWAMKYVPQRYRESQTQWFGKRGMPWHLTHVTRYCNGTYESQTLVHIFQQCKQDSSIVSSIMQHAVETIQRSYPELKEVFFRSDNADAITILGYFREPLLAANALTFLSLKEAKGLVTEWRQPSRLILAYMLMMSRPLSK